MDLPVELLVDGRWHRVAMADLSATGMFVQGAIVPAGTAIGIAIEHGGERFATAAKVTHQLASADAQTLARGTGIGIAFSTPSAAFASEVDRLLRRARGIQAQPLHVVVGDPEPRLVERLSAALSAAGCSVAVATTGMEVLSACVRRAPNLVIVARELPCFDGMQVLERLACHDTLSATPVMIMSSEPGELAEAFDRGAADVISKPFSMLELIARARRIARAVRRAEPVALSGNLAELALPALLTMLEQERKTGRVVLSNGHAAWIDVVAGRIVDAGWSRGELHPRAVAMAVLDWCHGTFKFTASAVARFEPDLGMPITHLLLERARQDDEASQPMLVAGAG